MVTLAPFRALRYDPAVAGPAAATSAPPYDELDPARYAAHRHSNPHTVLELLAGDAAAEGHDRARETLSRWLRTGVLRRDAAAGLHPYEITLPAGPGADAGRAVRGVIGALDLGGLDGGALLAHEEVDPSRVRRRAARLAAVPIDLTPVVAVHAGGAGAHVRTVLADARAHPPQVDLTDELGARHRLWRVDDPATIDRVVQALRPVTAVLADGHHRVAAMRLLASGTRTGGLPGPPAREGRPVEVAEGWGSTTAWVVDADHDGPELRAVHRALRTPLPRSPDGTPAVPGFHATPWTRAPEALPAALGTLPTGSAGLVDGAGSWVLEPVGVGVAATGSRPSDATARSLADVDVHIWLHDILPGLVPGGGADPLADLSGVRELLAGGAAAEVLVLRAPTTAQVLAVARAGARMPPKSTSFRPKPRAGLLLRALDGVPPGQPGR